MSSVTSFAVSFTSCAFVMSACVHATRGGCGIGTHTHLQAQDVGFQLFQHHGNSTEQRDGATQAAQPHVPRNNAQGATSRRHHPAWAAADAPMLRRLRVPESRVA